MGSVLQMPADGVLQVRHRRLGPKYGVEYGISKLGGSRWDFNNGWVAAKPDMSTYWIMYSADPPNPRLTGIYRYNELYYDNFPAYGETWVYYAVSNNGVFGSEMIPAVDNQPDSYSYVACPTYCPSTNELWWIATSLGVVDGQPGLADGNAQILRGPADGAAADSVEVFTEPMVTYNNVFSGSNTDWCVLWLKYDHVRDCMWAWITNNDVTFVGTPNVPNTRNGGYVGLLKFSTDGTLLDTIQFTSWADQLWGDDETAGQGHWDVGLQRWFTVGHDGLFWYTTRYQEDSVHGVSNGVEWPADDGGNLMRLMSYNPDTNTHTLYSPELAWEAEAPGFLLDGRLILTRAISSFSEDFIIYDPSTGEEENIGLPSGLPTGSSARFSQFWTSSDLDAEFPGILVGEHEGGVYRLLPGHYGLTVTSADTDFEKPWLTTDTPIYDTVEGEVHEATYGPFREGDHVRLGLLLQREAGGQLEPAAADLAISRRTAGVLDFSVDGESKSAYWEWDEEAGEITILWAGLEEFGFVVRDAAETVISLEAGGIDTDPPAQILDNIVRVITLEEVVPIGVVEPGPLEADGDNDGCPDDSQGLPFADNPPFVAGYDTGPNE